MLKENTFYCNTSRLAFKIMNYSILIHPSFHTYSFFLLPHPCNEHTQAIYYYNYPENGLQYKKQDLQCNCFCCIHFCIRLHFHSIQKARGGLSYASNLLEYANKSVRPNLAAPICRKMAFIKKWEFKLWVVAFVVFFVCAVNGFINRTEVGKFID